jgi:hypothetical protein
MAHHRRELARLFDKLLYQPVQPNRESRQRSPLVLRSL